MRFGADVALVLLLAAGVSRAHEVMDNCNVKDSDGNVLFDFTPLFRGDASINWQAVDSRPNMVYYMNICGHLSDAGGKNDEQSHACVASDHVDEGAAVCQALRTPGGDDDNGKLPLGLGLADSGTFHLIDPSDYSAGVKLKFSGGSKNKADCHGQFARSSEIQFTCGDSLGSPTFLEETPDCVYVFEWKTDVVCKGHTNHKEEIKCDVEGGDHVYNLSPLVRTAHNWEAVDTREASAFTYLLNLCRPLVDDGKTTEGCTNLENSGACQKTPDGAHDLGMVTKPVYDADGGLYVEFVMGDDCAGHSTKRTGIIYFSCPTDPSAGLGHPVFREETGSCQYVFDWESSAACPIGHENEGKDCKVSDYQGNVYDLSDISHVEWDVKDNWGTTVASVAVCDHIEAGCGGDKFAGACFFDSKTGQTPQSLGTFHNNVEFLNDNLFLRYNSSIKCPVGEDNYKSILIKFECDADATPPPLDEIRQQATLVRSYPDCFYEVSVKTSLACPPKHEDCLVQGGGQTYDLTALSTGAQSWIVQDEREGDKYQYQINVCQSVRKPKPTCAEAQAGGYQLKPGTDDCYSLGKVASPALVDGKLQAKYQDGTHCHVGTDQETPRTMIINFECGENIGEPTFLEELDGCSYVFVWTSSAACPIEVAVGADCAVEDESTGFKFDFNPLKDHGTYKLDDGYAIALCRHAKDCPTGSASCKGSDDLGRFSAAPVYNDGQITLEYISADTCKGSRAQVKTLIKFRCAPGVDGLDGPRHVFSDECSHEFEWATKLACQPKHEAIDCAVSDPEGNMYDLTRLVNPESNYETAGADGFLYVINVCRPIVPITGSTCHLDAAACQIEKGTDRTDKSLGVPSKPRWDAEKKRVYIEYLHGTDKCKGVFERTSRIDFICPKDGEEKQVHFVGESELDCTYYFAWETPAACPVSIISGDNCVVKDPFTGMTLDLNPLKNQGPFAVDAGDYKYELGVCGSEVACGSGTTAGACQTKPSEANSFSPKALGAGTSEIHFENSQLTLKYTGGAACHSNSFKRSTVISFVCDKEAGYGKPEFEEELGSCTYVFRWRTELACLPQLDCKAVDGKRTLEYDLSSLANNEKNWVATDKHDGGKFQFWLNLCRPLVPEPAQTGWTCGPFAAGCQLASENRYFELGFPAGPKVDPESGDLFVELEGGDVCHGKYNRSVHIKFTCPVREGKPAVGILGAPAYLYESAECRSFFEWETSAACPVGGDLPTEPPRGDCTTVHPVWGDVIDLNSLADREFTVDGVDGADTYTYTVGVCSDVDVDGCSSAGACQTKATDTDFAKNMGSSTRDLQWVDGELTLKYTGGEDCHDSDTRTTTITFSCDRTATDPILRFIEETADCVYRFEMATDKVCLHSKEVECVALDPNSHKEYDLSSLVKPSNNWLASMPLGYRGATVWINVCRSVTPLEDGSNKCPPDASACMRNEDGQIISLGKVAPPQVLVTGQIAMALEHGGTCPTDSSKKASAVIEFVCDRSGKSEGPALVTFTENCEYAFEWRTPAACTLEGPTTTPPPKDAKTLPTSECAFTDGRGYKYDLTPLSSEDFTATNPNTDENGNEYTYKMRACAAASGCAQEKGSADCQLQGSGHWSLGRFVSKPTVEGGSVRVHYQHGDVCHGKYERSSSIEFVCDEAAGKGAPRYVAETADCVYEFEWRTVHACPQAMPAPVECFVEDPKTGAEYDLTVLTRTGDEASWLSRDDTAKEDGGKYEFLLNVCGPLTKNLNGGALGDCDGAAACQTFLDDTPAKPIGHAVNDPEIRSNGDIVLRYTLPEASTQLCHGQYHRSTLITLTCRPGTRGEPVYVGESDECEYHFTWATSAACNIANRTRGSNCKVRDPVTDVEYDLSPLQKKRQSIKSGDKKYDYAIGVCKDLDDDCSGFAGDSVGICQKSSSGSSFALGTANSEPVLFDGHLRMEYTDGEMCHRGTSKEAPRSAFVQFECDKEAGDGVPEFLWESDKCTYFFKWRTVHACASTPDVQCLTVDKAGNEYDLSALSLPSDNWEVLDELKKDSHRYYINVCHNLNPTAAIAGCSTMASGACQQDPSGGKSYSLGRIAGPKYDEDKGLMIQYTQGDAELCPNTGRAVTIFFKCKTDSDGLPLGVPEFDREPTACKYEITWHSTAACKVTQQTAAHKCKLVDPVTRQVMDFTALANAEPAEVTAPDGHVYHLNPCASLPGPGECKGANGCQDTTDGRHFSLGKASGLELHGTEVVGRLKSGSKCHNKYQRSAFIQFKCGVSTGDNVAEFISESDECEYTFEWTTPFACLRQGQECVVHENGFDYDLSSLAKPDSATGITTSAGMLYLNVCNGVHKIGCDPASGACLKLDDGTFLNVGSFSDVKPSIIDGKARLSYRGGTCPPQEGGEDHVATTHIVFLCNKNKQEQGPRLQQLTHSATGCSFNVHWNTCEVCPGINPCASAGITTQPPLDVSTTAGDSEATGSPSSKKSHGGAVAAGILIPASLILLVLVFRNPERRQAVLGLCSSFKPSGFKPTYKYQPVNMALESEDEGQELTSVASSGGEEPAAVGMKSMVDALNSESEEDDLLLGI